MFYEFSHTFTQIMLIDFPYMRLLPAVFIPVIVKCNNLVTDVVKLTVKQVAPVNGIMSIYDLNSTAIVLDYICDVIE